MVVGVTEKLIPCVNDAILLIRLLALYRSFCLFVFRHIFLLPGWTDLQQTFISYGVRNQPCNLSTLYTLSLSFKLPPFIVQHVSSVRGQNSSNQV
jgi:hypothetical protein